MMKMVITLLGGSILLLALAVVPACVTTEGSVFTTKPSPEEAVRTRVQLARSYIGEGNWEDAKRNLKIAADIDPNAPEVHEAFALVYQSTGEDELAEASFRKAISLRRNYSRARNNYAAFLYSKGRYRDAEKQLKIVIKDTLYESRPQAFINLGLCKVQLGDFEGAREALIRALAMDRTNRLATLELANVEYELGNWSDAERHLATYRTLTRGQSARALWLGVRLAHKLDDPNAEASYALALRNMFPDSAEFQAYEQALQSGEL
jgi:type IV pilus assembly protein PilF